MVVYLTIVTKITMIISIIIFLKNKKGRVMKKGIIIILTVLMVVSLMAKLNHEIYAKSNVESRENEAIKMYDLEEQDSVIEEISGAVVISSNQVISNQIINGDLYIAPNIKLYTYNLTVNGNIYVLGSLMGENISVKGTVYCDNAMSGDGIILNSGTFAWNGDCSIYEILCTNQFVSRIPLRFDKELMADSNGDLILKGATLNIADMTVNGNIVKLDSKGCFDQKINIGESDQIIITRHIEGWYDLVQAIGVQHERPQSLKIISLPDKTVYQDGEKLDSKGLKVKAIYKDGVEKDVTNYVQLSNINNIGINTIKVRYRECETTFNVEVNEVKAESILLNKSNITLEIGKVDQLEALILPNNTSNKNVSYESSDNSIALVDNDGKITALKEGTVFITAKTSNNLKTRCKVNVIEHVHQWNVGKAIKEPECTTVGKKEYICETCGEKRTEELAATGHDWSGEYIVDKKATCTEKGIESIHCKVCNEIKEGSEREIPILDHQWNEGRVIKRANCTEAGEKEYTCNTCGEKKTEELTATGHNWSSEYTVDKKATCTENGIESIHCEICGKIKEGSKKEIPVKDHKWNEGKVIKEANCTQVGEKEYTCETCGEKKTEELAAKGHDWSSEYTVDKKGTCTEDGIESIHCKVCGELKQGTEKLIPANGHTPSDVKNKKESTYISEGYTGDIYCKICGEKISTGQKIKKLTAEIPQKIMIKKLTAGKKKFKVKFKSINNAVKYQIQYSLKKSMKSAKVKTVTKTTNTIKKLKSKKKYYVRVRAINIQGKEGSWSKVSKIKVK